MSDQESSEMEVDSDASDDEDKEDSDSEEDKEDDSDEDSDDGKNSERDEDLLPIERANIKLKKKQKKERFVYNLFVVFVKTFEQ